jgi:hypothetical protein
VTIDINAGSKMFFSSVLRCILGIIVYNMQRRTQENNILDMSLVTILILNRRGLLGRAVWARGCVERKDQYLFCLLCSMYVFLSCIFSCFRYFSLFLVYNQHQWSTHTAYNL